MGVVRDCSGAAMSVGCGVAELGRRGTGRAGKGRDQREEKSERVGMGMGGIGVGRWSGSCGWQHRFASCETGLHFLDRNVMTVSDGRVVHTGRLPASGQ